MSQVTREAGQLIDRDLGRDVRLEDGTAGRLTGTYSVGDQVVLTIDGHPHEVLATTPVTVTLTPG